MSLSHAPDRTGLGLTGVVPLYAPTFRAAEEEARRVAEEAKRTREAAKAELKLLRKKLRAVAEGTGADMGRVHVFGAELHDCRLTGMRVRSLSVRCKAPAVTTKGLHGPRGVATASYFAAWAYAAIQIALTACVSKVVVKTVVFSSTQQVGSG